MSEQAKINKAIEGILECVSGHHYQVSTSILTTALMIVFDAGIKDGFLTKKEAVEKALLIGGACEEILNDFDKLNLPFEMNQ